MTLQTNRSIFRFSLFAFVFLIPVSPGLSIKFLIVSIFFSLILVRNDEWLSTLIKSSWDLLLYYLVLVIGLIYSDDMSSGMSVLERNLSLIMVPFLLSKVDHLDKKFLNTTFSVFTVGVITASLICLGYAVWRDMYLDFHHGYYYDQFTTIIDSQPTYMAYYVCFSIIFLLYFLSYESTTTFQKTGISFAIIFLSVILMLTAGRSTFASMLMMTSFFFLKLLFETAPLRNRLLGIAVTTLLVAIIFFQSPYVRKIIPDFPNGRSGSMQQIRGDSWERLILWKSAIEASSNIMVGVGTGDHGVVMNEYFRSHGLPEYAESNLNAHNQYIQILFSNGLIGLAAVLILMMRPIMLSVWRQNIFGMLTFFPFLIYGISEVFLGRYQGIIFFVLLHKLFVRYLSRKG